MSSKKRFGLVMVEIEKGLQSVSCELEQIAREFAKLKKFLEESDGEYIDSSSQEKEKEQDQTKDNDQEYNEEDDKDTHESKDDVEDTHESKDDVEDTHESKDDEDDEESEEEEYDEEERRASSFHVEQEVLEIVEIKMTLKLKKKLRLVFKEWCRYIFRERPKQLSLRGIRKWFAKSGIRMNEKEITELFDTFRKKESIGLNLSFGEFYAFLKIHVKENELNLYNAVILLVTCSPPKDISGSE